MLNKIKKYYCNHGFIGTLVWLFSKPQHIVMKKINYYKCLNIKEGNIKNYVFYKKKVFIFTGIPYFDIGGGQRSSQLTKEFNKIGYDVVYLYRIPSSESKICKMEIPTVIHKFIKNFKLEEFKKLLNKNDIVIFEIPAKEFVPFMEYAIKVNNKIIYETIDNWETNLGDGFFDKKSLNTFIINSNYLTATAKPLINQINKYQEKLSIKKNVYYLPNAVDVNLFDYNKKYDVPSDLIIGKKTFIYYGSLWGSWFDWNIIKYISSLDKEYQINLIGDYNNILHIVRTMPSNVHFLGLKSQKELPNYLKYSDYTLLPFKTDSIGNYVSPLKVFEYIAMHKITISSKLPDIIGYPNVKFIDNINDIDLIVKGKNVIDVKKTNDFIKSNSWNNRCNEIIKIVSEVENE
mgnify:FL=1